MYGIVPYGKEKFEVQKNGSSVAIFWNQAEAQAFIEMHGSLATAEAHLAARRALNDELRAENTDLRIELTTAIMTHEAMQTRLAAAEGLAEACRVLLREVMHYDHTWSVPTWLEEEPTVVDFRAALAAWEGEKGDNP